MNCIPRYSTLNSYQLKQIKIIDRTCRDVTFKASYATMPHDQLPWFHPLGAPINSPAAAPACRCVRSRSIAFQGTHPSRGHALDSSSVSLTEATLRKLAAAVHGVPFTFFLECRREETRNDTFKTIRTRVPAKARPGSTERLRRTGAAPALRVYRRLKACISPGRPGWSTAGWHGVRELDM